MVRQLRDEIKSFILAGHETSASMLTWSLYEASRSPQILEHARREGLAVFGGGRRRSVDDRDEFQSIPLPARDELDKLEYTVRILKVSALTRQRFALLVRRAARATRCSCM